MAKFAKSEKQAADVMKQLQGNVIQSVRTVSNYEQCLKNVCDWVKENRISKDGLEGINRSEAIQYLEQRAEQVGQKTLDMERQAIQAMFKHVTGILTGKDTLPVIQSEKAQISESRAYSKDQVELIACSQNDKNSLSTQIAYSAGLRAHELITLQKIEHQTPDKRPALESKFIGREGQSYTVTGKGGLTREVRIPNHLANQLEKTKLTTPKQITDRGIKYTQHYDIAGGKNWSSSFSKASDRILGWSKGAHGVRHSYAQERMREVQNQGISRDMALQTVSQEMGHFRAEITEVYLN